MTQPNGDVPQIYSPDATGGPAIRINQIGEGRLLVITPLEFEPNAPAFDDGETGPRVTADIAILDGPIPLQYGGSIQKRRPHTMEFRQLPALVRGVWIQEKTLVFQIKGRIGLGVVVGRLGKGQATKGNPPWVLFDPTPGDIEQAKAWLAAKAVGQWVNPEPVEIGGTQPVAQAPGNYPQPASPGYGYQPPAPAPQQPAYVQPPPAQAYPTHVQPQPAYEPWQPPTAPPPAPPAPEPLMPPGFDPNRWAAMTPADKQNAAAWYAQQAGQYAPPAPPQAQPAQPPASQQGGPAYW